MFSLRITITTLRTKGIQPLHHSALLSFFASQQHSQSLLLPLLLKPEGGLEQPPQIPAPCPDQSPFSTDTKSNKLTFPMSCLSRKILPPGQPYQQDTDCKDAGSPLSYSTVPLLSLDLGAEIVALHFHKNITWNKILKEAMHLQFFLRRFFSVELSLCHCGYFTTNSR